MAETAVVVIPRRSRTNNSNKGGNLLSTITTTAAVAAATTSRSNRRIINSEHLQEAEAEVEEVDHPSINNNSNLDRVLLLPMDQQ